MKNKTIIESLICLLNGRKKIEQSLTNKTKKKDLESINYLVKQSIRQFNIPQEKQHISKKAQERWNEITDDCIWNHAFRSKVKCNKLTVPLKYGQYKGAEKDPIDQDIFPGDELVFNDMFHRDHTVPVSLIIKELYKLDHISEDAVNKILDNMHISVILKEEDKKIGRTLGRTIDFQQVINDIYNKKGIFLVD